MLSFSASAVGAFIREVREDAGLNQQTIAEWLDLDQAAISRIERGISQLKVSQWLEFWARLDAAIEESEIKSLDQLRIIFTERSRASNNGMTILVYAVDRRQKKRLRASLRNGRLCIMFAETPNELKEFLSIERANTAIYFNRNNAALLRLINRRSRSKRKKRQVQS